MIASTITGLNNLGEYGLIGAIIGALFITIGYFMKGLSRKDEQHSAFIQQILREDREERAIERTEHKEATIRLSGAIDQLTAELRKR